MKASELARMSARHGSGILSLSQGHTAVQMCWGQLGLSFFLGGEGIRPSTYFSHCQNMFSSLSLQINSFKRLCLN